MRGKRTQHLFTAVGECMIFLTISHALLPSLMVVTDNRGGGASGRHRRMDFELTRSTRWTPIGVRRERRDREAPTTWLLATPIRKTEC